MGCPENQKCLALLETFGFVGGGAVLVLGRCVFEFDMNLRRYSSEVFEQRD